MRSSQTLIRWFALGLLVTGVVTGSALVQTATVSAQDGPQFSNWGPGMAPPDEEGPDSAASSSSGSGDTERYAAPGAPGREAAPAPGVILAGCRFDLRGTWSNDGRMTSPTRQSYSATVTVRQYRSWIQAEQDDGTSYYGRCIGNRLTFDVYSGYQFVGTQSGTVSATNNGVSWRPRGFWTENGLEAAAAPAPGSSGARASFTWTTWYGSGRETWTR